MGIRRRRDWAWLTLSLSHVVAFALPIPVLADGGAIEAHAEPGLVLGAKVGLGVGAPISDFGLSVPFEIELGYLLPLPAPVLHAIQVFASGGYAAAQHADQSTAADPRLPGDGIGHFTLDQRLFSLSAGVLGRLPLASQRFAPYLALGYRGYLVSAETHGQVAGRQLGEHTERGVAHGLFAALGLDVFLGPGAVLAELQLAYAQRDAYILRDANLGGLQLFVGYRLILGSPVEGRTRRAPAQVRQKPESIPASHPAAQAPQPRMEPSDPSPPPAAADPEPEASASQSPLPATRGQIRGHVRSLEGEPLRATVLVQPGDLRAESTGDGTFSLDVEPGEFRVQLQAPGYRAHKSSVVVDENGITVLNVELTKE